MGAGDRILVGIIFIAGASASQFLSPAIFEQNENAIYMLAFFGLALFGSGFMGRLQRIQSARRSSPGSLRK